MSWRRRNSLLATTTTTAVPAATTTTAPITTTTLAPTTTTTVAPTPTTPASTTTSVSSPPTTIPPRASVNAGPLAQAGPIGTTLVFDAAGASGVATNAIEIAARVGGPFGTTVGSIAGTWTLGDDGRVTFAPAAGWHGTTTIVFRATTVNGTAEATLTATILPTSATQAAMTPLVVLEPSALSANLPSAVVASTVALKDPASAAWVLDLTIAGQGTFHVDSATGAVSFTAASGFAGATTPIDVRGRDAAGNETVAVLQVHGAAAALPRTGGGAAPLRLALCLVVIGAAGMLASRRRAVPAQR